MNVNEGAIDRSLRVLAGIALIALAYFQVIGLWGYVGLIPLVTGAAGTRPVYSLFGISTCPSGRG
jgi:hypothetical protein